MTGALLLLAAAAVFVASALAWPGRWRSWSRRVHRPLPLPITLLPGIGFALSAPGSTNWACRPAADALHHLLGAVRDLSLGARMVRARLVPQGQRAGVGPDLSDPAGAERRADLEARGRRQPRRRGRAVPPRAHPALEGDLDRARTAARSRTPSAVPEPPRAAWSCTTTGSRSAPRGSRTVCVGKTTAVAVSRGVQHRPSFRPAPAPTARSAPSGRPLGVRAARGRHAVRAIPVRGQLGKRKARESARPSGPAGEISAPRARLRADAAEVRSSTTTWTAWRSSPSSPTSRRRASAPTSWSPSRRSASGLRSRATPRCPCAPRARCCSATG